MIKVKKESGTHDPETILPVDPFFEFSNLIAADNK
jgi:hypothetical protein